MLFEFGGFFRKVWRGALLLGTLVIGANSLFVAPVSAATGINQQLNFQGRLLNAQGAVVVDGYYNVEFKIYQDGPGTAAGNPGGTLKWTEDWLNSNGNPVKLVNGYMSVQLGSINPFGDSIDWNQDTIWLSINIGNTTSCTVTTNFTANCGGDGEMLPMKRLSAVPYALNSARLGGLTAAGFIQNTTTVQTATNMAIDGTARADTGILTPYIDTNTATALNIGTTNATSINLNQNVTVAANKTLTLAGGTTANRPASPTEGTLWYDTTTKQLLVYSNGKWQADRSTSTKIVAASNASQALKDGADYVATGTGDQTVINNALTAAAGGKVYLTEGTYTINGSISVPNNTTLAGAGAGTIITIPSAFNADINAITNTTTGGNGTGIVIQDLKLDGDRANQTAGTINGIYFNGMGGTNSPGGKVANLWVNNWRTRGIELSGSSNSIISGTINSNNGVYGIRLNASSYNNVVTGNVITGSTYGITLDGAYANTVSGNTVRGAANGIQIGSGSTGNTISGNILQENSGSGIALNSGSHNAMSGNKFTNNGGTVNNNAITLINGSSSNTITGNNITDSSATTTNYAISITDSGSSSNYLADNTLGTGTINDAGTGTIYGGQANGTAYLIQPATNITLGSASTTNILRGNTGVTLSATVGTTMVCQNGSSYLSACDASVLTPNATNFILNQNGTTQAGNFNIQGTSTTAPTAVFWQAAGGTSNILEVKISNGTSKFVIDGGGETRVANQLTVGNGTTGIGSGARLEILATPNGVGQVIRGTSGQNADLLQLQNITGNVLAAFGATGDLSVQNVSVAANKTLTLAGGTTANRPASPTEGMLWYDTDTKQLLTYANGKWQADRNTATKVVAASNASQALKDSADYVATGTGDQTVINNALTAAAGGKVYLTEGTFTVNASISVPNNTTLAGAGAGTIITIPNGFNTSISAITNTTTGGNGTGIVIQDLRLNGNKANQTSGTMSGIRFDGVGSGTGSSAIQGGKIMNIWADNWYNGSGAITLFYSANSIVSGNVANANSNNGIFLTSSSNITVTGNSTQGNNNGIAVNNGASNTLTGNTTQRNGNGFNIDGTSRNGTYTGNNVWGNTTNGFNIIGNSNNNTISGNNIYDNGGSTGNFGIDIANSSNNTITGNNITDTSATGTNYAINIADSGSNNNYLADNTLGSGSINDLGTGTVYANQSRAANGGQLTNRTANDTQAFTVQNASGANIFAVDTANSQVVIGNASTAGKLTVSDGSGHTGSIVMGTVAGNYTYTIPTTNADDTFCMVTLGNCSVAASGAILNQNSSQQASANFWISGTGRADTSLLTPLLDATTAGTALNIGTTNASAINLNQNVTVAANKSLRLVGGTTANRPASPTEGMLWFDTTTKQLLVYANGKWQADRSTSTKIVAASNASQALKDGADYVATGTGDQSVINTALTAAAGGKVYLTEGTYTVNASISVPNNTTLAGAGAGTVITIPNAFNADINTITNTTTGGNGTSITIQDLRLEGNKANQASGTIRPIQLNGVGSGSGSTGVQGGKIANVWINNWRGGANIWNSSNTILTGSTMQGNDIALYVDNSLHSTVTNNVSQGNAEGIRLWASSNSVVSNNIVRDNSVAGININSNSNNNVISDNKLSNNGNTTANNSISLSASDSNTITGNSITDTSATTTNYAINISDSTSDTNYLADNTLGGGSIYDAGTGTIYGGQVNAAGNFLIQPAGTIELMKSTNVTGTLSASTGVLAPSVDRASPGTLTIGTNATNTTAITIGSGSVTTTIAGNTGVTLNATTGTTMVCRNTTGLLSTCDATYLTPTTTNFIQNQAGTPGTAQTGNFNITGTGIAATLQAASVLGTTFDTATATALNIGTTNATAINLNKNVTVAAGRSLTLAGGTTANRPASPTEGMMWFDTTTRQLLVYANGKWQADRNTATKVVAASNASQALRDSADYVATGTNDQTVINNALTAAAGGKVYLTEGTFTVSGAISMPNNTTLAGAGQGTLVQLADLDADVNAIMNSDLSTGTGIVIQDMKLNGRTDLNTAGYQTAVDFLNIGSPSLPGATLRGLQVMNFRGAGLRLRNITNSTISGNTFSGINISSGDSAVYDTGSMDVVYSGNTFSNNFWGLRTDSTSHETVTSNFFSNNNVGITSSNANRNTISNNTFNGNAEIVELYQVSHTIVSGNISTGSNWRGIVLDASSDNIVSDNRIQNSGNTDYNDAIIVTGNADRNSIIGNSISDTSAITTNYAIRIATSTADANYLASNTLGGGTVNDAGTGTIYAGQFASSTSYLLQPATNITIGSASTTTTLQGNTAVTLNATAATGMVCRNTGTGVLSVCDATILTPTATNFIRNQNSAVQSGGTFWISGSGRSDTSLLTPTLDTAVAGTLNIGTTTATGITLGKTGVATTAAGGLLSNSVDTISATALTLGGTTASSINIGKSSAATAVLSSTTTFGTSGSTTTLQGAAQTANNNPGNEMIIRGSNGLGNGAGGNVTIQGGNSGVSGTVGGNLTLAGGTGSTSNGLVILGTSAFNTNSTDSGCYPSGADSGSTSNCTISQSSVNNYASVIVGFTNDGQTAFMPSPSIITAGRVVYVTASATTKDFTLSVNGGGTGNLIAMRKNTTATMIWNGSAWTAAGASSSTTLQAAYDNTLQSAGGAELVVSKTSATNGLTIRDSSVNSVNGALLTVQSSSAANLFSVNSNVTEYATDAGAEVYGATTSTFPANTWSAVNGSTVTRYTTAGNNIATGQGSVSIATSTTAGSGAANRLSTTLTPNMTYNVSFTTRLLSGTFTDLEIYYSINGSATSVPCATGKAAATSIWTKVNCAFAAPASGITANNAILIRQTGSGTARTFYVDNLSVTIAADFNYATDGSATDGDNFTTNWLFGGLGTGSVTRNLTDGQDASDSAQVTLTAGAANAGIRNKLSLNPLPNTLYRVTVYAKVASGTFNDFKVRYSRDGSTTAGGNYVDCVDYNTRTLSTTAWTRVTCFIQTDGTTATNPHVYFVEETSAARTFRVDAFTMTLTTNTAPNVQIGGGENGGPTTLLTLDKAASAPIAINNDALLGSMYYDTTLGKLQCYEADGWGACGSSPDTIVTISPEFTNAVLHGTGVGTMVSDLCSDTLNINDGSSGQPNICGTNETYNFYRWTSPQPSAQTYGVYVTYQLPASFKSFESGSTSIMGRTDSANSTIEYQVYRNDAATGLTTCGPSVLVSSGAAASWQPGVATGTSDPSTCGFAPGNSIVFRISVTASQNANAYIGNLNFIFSNR